MGIVDAIVWFGWTAIIFIGLLVLVSMVGLPKKGEQDND